MTKALFPKVVTLDQKALREAAVQLWHVAFESVAPNIIIGIRTGGYYVAEKMAEVAPSGTPLLAITCQRPSTSIRRKSSIIKYFLSKFPYVVTDKLRVIEHFLLARCMKPRARIVAEPDKKEVDAIARLVRSYGAGARVLVVDDSIDSGVTLSTVLDVLRREIGPSVMLKTAVITVTMQTPLVQPDFVLYHNILCRCPWSYDYKA